MSSSAADSVPSDAAGLSMATAVGSLLIGTTTSLGLNLTSPSHSLTNGTATVGASNLQNYIASQANAMPSIQPFQLEAFRPSTRTIVEAVKALNIQDVQWFLLQLAREKGKRIPVPPTIPPTPRSAAVSPVGMNGTPNTPTTNGTPAAAASSSSSSPLAPSNGVPSPSPPAAEVVQTDLKPSPFLAELPSNALQLPTSSPYILDILLDTILGLQAKNEFAEIQKQKSANEAKAKADGIDVKLVNLLTPLPPITPPSLYLPSPQSEHAYQILDEIVKAVDIVGVNSLNKAAAIDFLKMSDIPFPFIEKGADSGDASGSASGTGSGSGSGSAALAGSGEWSIQPEWKRRVELLERYGAVLDVERKSEEEEALDAAWTKKKKSAAVPFPPLPPPPRPSEFIFPPFTPEDRQTQKSYLQHTYLSLLEKRQLFLKLLSEVLTRVRNIRAQGNYQLGVLKSATEQRVNKILQDIKSFEDLSFQASHSKEDALAQQAIDTSNAEKLERQAMVVRKEEIAAHRQAVAIKGMRLVTQKNELLTQRVQTAKEKYLSLRQQQQSTVHAVETARVDLARINKEFDKYALAIEARQKQANDLTEKESKMKEYVASFELAVKAAKKSLKETHVLVAKSRALTASKQVVEFEMCGRAVTLLYAGISGVSNLFLKFFRCMSPAPDPKDPNPEVVWCPEPCVVTELCSPGPNRSVSQVANPVWRPVKIDIWKLCEAEFDRYFKVEVWDCDASIRQVTQVVRSAIDQARLDSEAKTRAALDEAKSDTPTQLNPDGTPIQPTPIAQNSTPASVTLPSTATIKYGYVGQSVCTLQQLIDAQKKRRAEQEASAAVSAPSPGVLVLPIINANQWAARNNVNLYTDSGQLIFASFKIMEDQ